MDHRSVRLFTLVTELIILALICTLLLAYIIYLLDPVFRSDIKPRVAGQTNIRPDAL